VAQASIQYLPLFHQAAAASTFFTQVFTTFSSPFSSAFLIFLLRLSATLRPILTLVRHFSLIAMKSATLGQHWQPWDPTPRQYACLGPREEGGARFSKLSAEICYVANDKPGEQAERRSLPDSEMSTVYIRGAGDSSQLQKPTGHARLPSTGSAVGSVHALGSRTR